MHSQRVASSLKTKILTPILLDTEEEEVVEAVAVIGVEEAVEGEDMVAGQVAMEGNNANLLLIQAAARELTALSCILLVHTIHPNRPLIPVKLQRSLVNRTLLQ